MTLPYYHLIPKEYKANLQFRSKLIEFAQTGKEAQQELWIACKRDPLFYINAFCFTYDPRLKSHKTVPFITYPFQDTAIIGLLNAIRQGYDELWEKSRDMGASWMCLTAFEYLWHFYAGNSFLFGSYKEDLVDKPGDPKAHFWKIDFLHRNQPGWLVPTITRTSMHFGNEDNGSTIDGESTNENFARGDRRTAVLLDEFAMVALGDRILTNTSDVTNCRIFNSTPKGTANAFYRKRMDGTKVRTLHWTLHPVKSKGLYHDGDKPRSPWYDKECKRRHPVEVAQELDIDYQGSVSQWFEMPVIDRIQREDCIPPVWSGDIVDGKPVPQQNGPLSLWIRPDGKGEMPIDRSYVIGVDVALGTGASNSAACVYDKKTGEKVGEYASPTINPTTFAKKCVDIALLFKGEGNRGAYLLWEASGPGNLFTRGILDTSFRHIYFDEQDDKAITHKKSKKPGWYSSKDKKRELLNDYRDALKSGRIVNRSHTAVEECRHYVFSPNGQEVYHAASADTVDPTGANSNHGDRVIADALACRGLRETAREQQQKDPPILVGSLAERRQWMERQRKEKALSNW